LQRIPIRTPISTGVKAIDGLITLGQGQRMGIFAGSGVGKSVLLGMIAKNTSADVNVIALIGERGREVREFIERDLGEEGLNRSVVVAATSDTSPLVRIKGAFAATTIAEFFRDQGLNVLLMMDSVTRVAMAQREIGLAVGEPPATKGYTPSTFTLLPRLLERAGNFPQGSITGLYTVLVEGDDLNDPIADSARSILDGHVVLSRELANRGHYPAIDPLQSVSRVMSDVAEKNHLLKAREFLQLLSVYRETEDLINIGAYNKGTNPKIDQAIEKIDALNAFLQQEVEERRSFQEIVAQLTQLV
jgi:flagellum-specific ATP synthase